MSETVQVSQEAGLLRDIATQMTTAKEFTQQHKLAFRTAFDFLNACFPPASDEQYWDNVINLAGEKMKCSKDNPLSQLLIPVMVDYLYFLSKNKEDANAEG